MERRGKQNKQKSNSALSKKLSLLSNVTCLCRSAGKWDSSQQKDHLNKKQTKKSIATMTTWSEASSLS
jgi:hypothetical protein